MALAVYASDDTIDAHDDGLLDCAALVRMFEESEEATNEARKDAERDRDYVDSKQLTSDELAALEKRGQPPQIDNRIKTKIDYLVGLEKQQRIDPKALPRTPLHETDADAATQALRYVAETEDFDGKRSGVWRNLLVEGAGGFSVCVEPRKSSYGGGMMNTTAMTPAVEYDIVIRRIAWDRMFWDPHSSDMDFEDAGYLGVVIWMDYDEACIKYPDPSAKDALETTMRSAPSDTYDDKPKFNHWADKKRKRVRICQIWVRRDDQWHFAEYTKGGILKSGPSPYVTDTGESDCELFFQAAYRDRDNNVYGLVREMITLQDGINKRHSKALHLLNTVQVTALEGAVSDVEKARKEAARADGWIVVQPVNNGGINDNIKIETRLDLAAAQLQLLQEAKNSIDLKGPNATQMGDKTQGSSAASGRAIIASQQGGMISLGDLLDNLRHLDKRVFRAVWNRIRQYWTEEKWIRITDDERNIKWVGMNIDPEKMQQLQMQAQQNPQVANKIGGIVASVAELDCDIIIDEVPDVIASQEQFGMLVELKKMDVNNELPFRALVVASSIKDKSKMLDEMDKAKQTDPMAQKAKEIALTGEAAKVDETKSKTALNMARAQGETMPEMGAPMQPQPFELPSDIQVAEAAAGIDDKHAAAEHKRAQAEKTRVETMLAPAKAAHDARLAREQMDRQHLQHMAGVGQKMQSDKMRAKQQARRPNA